MPLPIKALDRLIERLAATYGTDWTRKWEGLETAAIKTVWAAELDVFGTPQGLARIAWAITNLPDRCPNAIEFKRLCYQAPTAEEKQLPAPAADPERVKAELAKLGHVASNSRPRTVRGDMRDWARRLIARHDAGEKIRPVSLRFAREAMGVQATETNGA